MSETSDETKRLLAQLAQRAQNSPELMAWVLKRYQQLEQLDDESLAAHFHTDMLGLARLALCKRPVSGDRFAKDTREIAEYANADTVKVAQAIRYVDSIEAIARRPNASTLEESAPQSNRTLSGVVAAARDREDSEEEREDDDVAGLRESKSD